MLEDTRYGWDPDEKAEDRNRRSIYVLAKRNMRLPLLEAFDQPDMHNSCPRRTNTTTAPQALEMLNGEATEEAARHWSGKLLSECGDDEAKLVREAYTEAYGRAPHDAEIKTAEHFLDQQAAELNTEADAAGRQSTADSDAGENQSRQSGGRGRFLPRHAVLQRVFVRRLKEADGMDRCNCHPAGGHPHFESAQSRRDFLLAPAAASGRWPSGRC